MVKKYKIYTNRILNAMLQIEKNQTARLAELKTYDCLSLKADKLSDGNSYYASAAKAGKDGKRHYKYLGKEPNDTVRYIKEARHLKKSLKILGKDIALLKTVIADLEEYDPESVDRHLPATYRRASLSVSTPADPRAARWKEWGEAEKKKHGIFHPEELTSKTDDGTYVRSKSEAIIYNLLLRLGVTFIYELPIRLKKKNKTRYPDFAILSEVDYKTVILIEHQGMMDDPKYSDRFNERVYDYLLDGYLNCSNIFYTFDGPDGSINTDPILDIIRLKIRPAAC